MRVVIIGGSHSGVSAAKELRKLSKDVEILLFEASSNLAYVGSGSRLLVKGEISNLEEAVLAHINSLRELDIRVFLNTAIQEILPKENKIVTEDVPQAKEYSYDFLIIATGSTQLNYLKEDKKIENLLEYKTLKQSKKTLSLLENTKRIGILGAGLIGVETADFLNQLGKEVFLIEKMSYPMFRYFDSESIAGLQQDIPDNVHLRLRSSIQSIHVKDQKVTGIQLDNGDKIPVDALIYSINGYPNDELTKDILIQHFDGTLKVNDYLQTSIPNIYGVGDAIASSFSETNEDIFIPLVSNAMRTGKLAAFNILMHNTLPYTPRQRTIGTKAFGTYLYSTGLIESEAALFGIEVKSVKKVFHQKNLWEKTEPVEITLVYQTEDLKIVGGQIITKSPDFSDLINHLSGLIQLGVDAKKLAFLDYYFMPELSLPVHYFNELALEILQDVL